MSEIRQWISLDPLDTLFCKGSESMIAGQDHLARSLFPPMPDTIVGAIRTTIMSQRGIPFKDFTHGKPDKVAELVSACPALGTPEKAGFEICGPVFGMKDTDDCFIPAPSHWFSEATDRKRHRETVTIQEAAPLERDICGLGLKGSVASPLMIPQPGSEDIRSLSGKWVNLAALKSMRGGKVDIRVVTSLDSYDPSRPAIAMTNVFHSPEVRTGIALEGNSRRVRSGYLYSFTQIRLHPGVSLLVGISERVCPGQLDEQGLLQLGGEQRLVRYAVTNGPKLPVSGSGWRIALGPIAAVSMNVGSLMSCPRASGALLRVAGWDMRQNFHKPIRTYYPAGTAIMAVDLETPFGFLSI